MSYVVEVPRYAYYGVSEWLKSLNVMPIVKGSTLELTQKQIELLLSSLPDPSLEVGGLDFELGIIADSQFIKEQYHA